MLPIVLEHIKGSDLPAEWIEKFKLPVERSFTVKIEPDTIDGLPPAPTLEERKKYLNILENLKADGVEDSEEWIRIIKAGKTKSKQRPDII